MRSRMSRATSARRLASGLCGEVTHRCTRDAKASSPPKAFADQPHRDRQPDGLAEGEALGRPDDVRRGAARRAKRAVSELGRHVQ